MLDEMKARSKMSPKSDFAQQKALGNNMDVDFISLIIDKAIHILFPSILSRQERVVELRAFLPHRSTTS